MKPGQPCTLYEDIGKIVAKLSEAQIQKGVFEALRKRGMPGVVFWHTPNDRSSRRKSGYLSGASDVMILHDGQFFALELKTDKGRATEDQLEFIDRVNSADGYAFCAKGLENALNVLEHWGVIRKAA